MDGLCDELLARAALSRDEDGRIGLRDLADRLVDLLHRRGVSDDALGLYERADLLAENLNLVRKLLVLEAPADGVNDLVEFEKLRDVVEGTELPCANRDVRGAKGRHHHNSGLG